MITRRKFDANGDSVVDCNSLISCAVLLALRASMQCRAKARNEDDKLLSMTGIVHDALTFPKSVPEAKM